MKIEKSRLNILLLGIVAVGVIIIAAVQVTNYVSERRQAQAHEERMQKIREHFDPEKRRKRQGDQVFNCIMTPSLCNRIEK